MEPPRQELLETISCRECSTSCIVSHGCLVCPRCGFTSEEDATLLLQQAEHERDGWCWRGNHVWFSNNNSNAYYDASPRSNRFKWLWNKCKETLAKLSLDNHNDSSLWPLLESIVARTAQLGWPCHQRWLSASSAACIYIACRIQAQVAVSMTDCSIAANCWLSETGKVYRQLWPLFQPTAVAANGQQQEDDASPSCSLLSLLSWRVCHVLCHQVLWTQDSELGKVYTQSEKLLWYAQQRWLLTGRKPIHVVVAAATLAATCCGVLQPQQRRQVWLKISTYIPCTEQSIRQRYNEFIDALIQDAQLWLPWADQVDRNNIYSNVSMLLTILGCCTNQKEDNSTTTPYLPTSPSVIPPSNDSSST